MGGALDALSAPVREQILADPLAGFRAIMDSAPVRDQAVIDDPAGSASIAGYCKEWMASSFGRGGG
jgi:hypothetical protein